VAQRLSQQLASFLAPLLPTVDQRLDRSARDRRLLVGAGCVAV